MTLDSRMSLDSLTAACQAVEAIPDTQRVADLRAHVRAAMGKPLVQWACPPRIDADFMGEPLAVRKARAIALKLSAMPDDLWQGQLFAGSMTLEEPRVHAEWGFPDYLTEAEKAEAARHGWGIHCFGHIVPDYPSLLAKGLNGIRADAEAQRPLASTPDERAFLDSVVIALDAVSAFALRLAARCDAESRTADAARTAELLQMAANLRQSPAGPARTFHQALQSVWLLHMIFHSTMNGNAMGRLEFVNGSDEKDRPTASARGIFLDNRARCW